MRDRLKQYAAALVVAALMAVVLWVVAQVAEKPAGPWWDVQKEQR